MAETSIIIRRLYCQGLSDNQFASASDVVSWLGAVQAQDYLGAKWALGLRLQHTTDNAIEQAFADGAILRTHVMRPTWHFVAPNDIRWLLELTGPRVTAKLATMDRRLEIDRLLLSRSYKIITGALQGGKQLTRAELGSALAENEIVAEGLRLTHIVMHAELDAVICSGPRRGKQFTYMLLDERVPQAKMLSRDEALVELVRRYYTGHGPATVHDFAWWSGLTITDTKEGLAMLDSDLKHQIIDGKTYFFSASLPPITEPKHTTYLLPTYDEFYVGYAGFDQLRRGGVEPRKNGVYDPPLVDNGQVIGSWRRTITKGVVTVELAPYAPLSTITSEAIKAATERYGQFLGLPVVIQV